MARPSLYDAAYCDAIAEHMKDGASATSFAADIGVDRSTISEWTKVHPEFSLALKQGKARAAAWWEKTGRECASTGKGNASMCIFGLKNMGEGDWFDKAQIEHEIADTLKDRLLRAQGRLTEN